MNITLRDVWKSGKVLRDNSFDSLNICQAKTGNFLTFCNDPDYVEIINANPAAVCVLTTGELAGRFRESLGVALAEDPKYEFFALHNRLTSAGIVKLGTENYVSPSAFIHPRAVVAENCYIGDNAYIGPNVTVESYSHISANCILHPGCVIGASGMEYKRLGNEVLRVVHGGGVYLAESVEVLANAVVSKDVFASYTTIGKQTKISILANIAHGAQIGKRCLIAGHAQIGCSVIGDDVWVGPAVTVSDGIRVGSRAQLKISSVVVKDVAEGEIVSGNFAVPHARHLREYARIMRGGTHEGGSR